MKNSFFKGKQVGMRTTASFTKKETDVSDISVTEDDNELVERTAREISDLFSRLQGDGISREGLKIGLASGDDSITVYLTHKDGLPLTLNEANLICRLSIDAGFSPRITNGGVEILHRLPKQKSGKLYARVLLLVRERLED